MVRLPLQCGSSLFLLFLQACFIQANHPLRDNGGRLVQSSLGVGLVHDFEAVVLEEERGTSQLVHYWRDNSKDNQPWSRGPVISTDATSSASIIQNNHKQSLEVLVQERNRDVVHYTRQGIQWVRSGVVSRKTTGAPCFVQSPAGNLEAVVLEGRDLVHYLLDNSVARPQWNRTKVITSKASGPGSIIVSSFGDNLEVMVLEGTDVTHYWRNKAADAYWINNGVVLSGVSGLGPGSFLQTSAVAKPSGNGNFELVVFSDSGKGTGNLTHWWKNNDVIPPKFAFPQTVTTSAVGPGSIIQSSLGDPAFGNLEVIVIEQPRTLVHYSRNSWNSWQKVAEISRIAIG